MNYETIILLWLGIAVATGLLASSRGRSGIAWFLAGLLLGIIAFAAVLLAPREQPQDEVPAPAESDVARWDQMLDDELDRGEHIRDRCDEIVSEIEAAFDGMIDGSDRLRLSTSYMDALDQLRHGSELLESAEKLGVPNSYAAVTEARTATRQLVSARHHLWSVRDALEHGNRIETRQKTLT